MQYTLSLWGGWVIGGLTSCAVLYMLHVIEVISPDPDFVDESMEKLCGEQQL